ncbi:iron transporter [Streptomyces sp. HNM0575]|uniref:IucA/IucC family protein n=1 Tax=Streptomyces sp. HNM0575 TaxID=2716338 RepID=UPI00145C6A28|nr:IucA/IucC family protein [Streptomyces sp. HNM0575]NLU73371.1 iron transporter [Streptomyces sp. HNM0575]
MTGTTTAHPPVPASAALPTADEAVAHTLLNCVLREMTDDGTHRITDGRLHLRLPLSGVELRVALRRTSLIGAHRFTGPVDERTPEGWARIGWRGLAARVHAELSLRTGTRNEEFTGQVAASHRAVSSALSRLRRGRSRTPDTPDTPDTGSRLDAYLASEQSLLLGHRFHPTPKAHGADPAAWTAYAPEEGARFPLRLLAVHEDFTAQDCADATALATLDGLGTAPAGFRLLPAHPWQFQLLHRHPAFAAAVSCGAVRDLGTRTAPVTPTASVRTVYDGTAFLKFSLDVRITNCLRKNAHYELTGAVALTRLLRPVLDDLAVRHPAAAVLREPAYRSLAVPGADGRADRTLLEGFGVIVREGLGPYVPDGATPLLAGALADEYPSGPGRVADLLEGAGPSSVIAWWDRYVDLVVPPVLSAFFLHGLILEPHLQNVVVCVDEDSTPAGVLFRDLEGTKLISGTHRDALAALPGEVARALTYDLRRGWDRVVYCLLVNHLAEMLSAVADLHPGAEPALWRSVRDTLARCAEDLNQPPLLRSLLAGAPLPAKANLLTRWQRTPDRESRYVRLPSPLIHETVTNGSVN